MANNNNESSPVLLGQNQPVSSVSNNANAKPNLLAQLKAVKSKMPLINSTVNSLFKRLSLCSSTVNNMAASEGDKTPIARNLSDLEQIAATGSPMKKLRLSSQVCSIPHPQKKQKGGEDAYFIGSTGLHVGIADGVGGWAEKGIDPSLYARTLMREAEVAFEHMNVSCPLEGLKFASCKANKIMGSSTACLLSIAESTDKVHLKSANLGDSGFLIIRGREIIFRTKEQQFNFNFPYQLGPTSRAKPTDADLADIELQEGDQIVMGTDGLFDNLFDYEILEIVVRMTRPSTPEEETIQSVKRKLLSSHDDFSLDSKLTIAEQIAHLASEKSKSAHSKTPFSQNAKLHGYKVPGGKIDDITVIFATLKASSTETTANVTVERTKGKHASLVH